MIEEDYREGTAHYQQCMEDISDLLTVMEPMVDTVTVMDDIREMVRKIKIISDGAWEDWDNMIATGSGKRWIPDWVYVNDGMILRTARILLVATAIDLECDYYGHSWIYKMERGSRRVSPEYLEHLLDDLEGLKERLMEEK